MSQISSSENAASPAPESASSAEDLEAIRDLLLGREKQQLEVLQERIENPVLHARDISRVLPEAVALASARDGQFASALTPAVESALKESVKRDPSALVAAVFPIIGPAIRQAIAEAFAKLVQSLNRTLDHSLSLQGLKWRLEAARTGKSFAEVVLAHTLVYRVEQALLIHRPTGVLLQHVQTPYVQGEDASLVSGMLTAIQDFAHDSFQVAEAETLHVLQVGELRVWVENSPRVTLAAVMRGEAPAEFRAVLQGALENIQREQGAALEAFDGDAAPFALARPHLELCLQAQFAGAGPGKPPARLLIAIAVLLVLGAGWLGFGLRERRRWAHYVERLKAEPGIVVTESGRRSGKFFVAGLRDTLAPDPAALLPDFKLTPAKVASRWEPYQALSPELIVKRAGSVLQPPAGITFRVQDGVLFAEGSAAGTWTEAARPRALLLPGVRGFDTRALVDETTATRAALQREIERSALLFEGALRLVAGQEGTINGLVEKIQKRQQAAAPNEPRLRVVVIGHTDKTGTAEENLRLSRQRADYVVSLLIARGVAATLLAPAGVGAREPVRPAASEADPLPDRRVTFRLGFGDALPGATAP